MLYAASLSGKQCKCGHFQNIRLFLAYASFIGFTVYQIDVKRAFFYGTIDEEVYVMQPPRFQDPEFPARLYKVEKAMGTIDQTLFIRRQREDFILVQVYVDDIIFGSTKLQLCREFEALMHEKFQMSAMSELNFFLGLQILQKEDGIFLSQDKYVGDTLKKFGYTDVRSSNTPMDKENPWGKDETGKDTIIATSTTEAEYVAAASCCGQVLWIQNQLLDYGLSMQCETLSREISTSILHFLHIAKTFDLVWIWLGGDYGNVFLNRVKAQEHQLSPITHPPQRHNHHHIPIFPHHHFLLLQLFPLPQFPLLPPSETTPLRQYTRRSRIVQSSALPPVADEPTSPVRDVSQGEACLTESGFIEDQDRTTIAKSSTLPHDSAIRVTSPAAAQEVEIKKLKERVKLLEDGKGMAAEGSGDDASIKGRRLDEEDVATERVSSDTEEIRLDEGEVAAEKVSDDTEEMATVLITMDAASVLSSRGVQVVPTAAAVAPANVSISTGSGVIPTATTTISTATPIFATATTVTPYTRRKGKEKMVETHTPKKKKRVQEQIDIQFARELEEELEREAQRMNAQIGRDEEIAKIHAEEELQQMIADHHSKILKYQANQRKSRTKKQKRDFYMAVIRNNLGWKVKDFNEMSFEEVEAKFKTVWEQIKGGVSKISKGEAA
nr:hypothetical protein [Tanacetum cinerariifolium]